MKNLNWRSVIVGFLVGVMLMALPFANTLGQLKGADLRIQLLLNFACSLPESEFQQLMVGIKAPADFVEIAGEQHEAAWQQVKSNLFAECFE